jgi:hypothetical protein
LKLGYSREHKKMKGRKKGPLAMRHGGWSGSLVVELPVGVEVGKLTGRMWATASILASMTATLESGGRERRLMARTSRCG